MSAITFSNKVFDREVAFCKVYSLESKEKLMNKDKSKEKNVFTIRINEADVDKARDLVTGLESVKIRKMEPNEK